MKKIISIMLICVLVLCAGCGSNGDSSKTAPADTASEDKKVVLGDNITGQDTGKETVKETDQENGQETDQETGQDTGKEQEEAPPADNSKKNLLDEKPAMDVSSLSVNDDGITKLSFKATSSFEALKQLNGKKVTINGYLATASPVDGSFIYLMNLPYQSCPFCVPNTTQLANTLEVTPEDGKKFEYTDQAVKVTGTLLCAEGDELFSDAYGYQFNVKLVDAEYKTLSEADMTEDMLHWQNISNSGIASDIYTMYNYVNLLVAWDVRAGSFTDENGNEIYAYYYPDDALTEIDYLYPFTKEDGYFEGLIDKIKKYNDPSMDFLIPNIENTQKLAEKAMAVIDNGDYECEYRYIEEFGSEDYVYTINGGDELWNEYCNLYWEFDDWLASWEL